MQELSGGDTNAERELLLQFRRYNEDDLRDLRSAIASDALDAVARAAHRIKGASRSVGALDLAELCDRIEMAARAKDRRALQASLIPFEREMRRLLLHIQGAETVT